MARVCSLPMERCVEEGNAQWRMGYLRRAGAACALLCGSSAIIGALTFAGGSAPECLPPTVLLAATAAFGFAVAACPSFARWVMRHVLRDERA